LEQVAALGGVAHAREQLALGVVVVEEAAAGAGVAGAEALADHAEATAGDLLVAADDDDRARAHVLLFADNLRDAGLAVVGECLGRMLA
jgi:hypothetical protein